MYKWLWVLFFVNAAYGASRGEQLYRSGDSSKRILACIACHGPHAQGNKEAGIPVLAKQHAKYIVSQLQAFKQNTRQNDTTGVMHAITVQMSVKDMRAVAKYIEQLE